MGNLSLSIACVTIFSFLGVISGCSTDENIIAECNAKHAGNYYGQFICQWNRESDKRNDIRIMREIEVSRRQAVLNECLKNQPKLLLATALEIHKSIKENILTKTKFLNEEQIEIIKEYNFGGVQKYGHSVFLKDKTLSVILDNTCGIDYPKLSVGVLIDSNFVPLALNAVYISSTNGNNLSEPIKELTYPVNSQ